MRVIYGEHPHSIHSVAAALTMQSPYFARRRGTRRMSSMNSVCSRISACFAVRRSPKRTEGLHRYSP